MKHSLIFIEIEMLFLFLHHRLYQAMDLYHAPLSLLAKAAPILGEELYDNILPLSWELLLDTSQQLAGSAGKKYALWLPRWCNVYDEDGNNHD